MIPPNPSEQFAGNESWFLNLPVLVFLNPLLLLLLFPLLWLETKHWFYPQRPYNGFSMHQWDIKQLCAKMFSRTPLFPSICIIMMAPAPPQLQQVSEPNELNHVNNKMQLYNKAVVFSLFVTYLIMNVSTYSLFCWVKLDKDWSTYKLNIKF